MLISNSVYLSEIFPTWMRAQGVAFSVSGLFTTTLIYTGAASTAFEEVGWKYYLGTQKSPSKGRIRRVILICLAA
jgi:hypothetical protein